MAKRAKGWWRGLVGDVVAMFMAFRDPQVPLSAKLVGAASVLYVLLPVDLIPDFIPIAGWLDDLAALPLASWLVGRLTATPVMNDLRRRAEEKVAWLRPRALAALVLGVVLAIVLVSYSWSAWRERRDARAAAAAAADQSPAAGAAGPRL